MLCPTIGIEWNPSACADDRSYTGEVDEKGDLDAAHDATANIEPAPSASAGDTGDTDEADENINLDASHDTDLDLTLPLGICTGHARLRPHADPEPTPGHHIGDIMNRFQMLSRSWSLS